MSEVATPDVVGTTLLLLVGDIEFGERLRPVDPVWAEALAGIIRSEGQRTPIEVCRLPGAARWTLVTGAHRLTALKLLDFVHVRAVEVGSGRAERRMAEVSENLWRRDLGPIDRAAFVAELHQLLRVRSGVAPDLAAATVAANARWQKIVKEQSDDASVILTDAFGWTDEIADGIGISRSAVERDLTLHRRLLPDVIARLRGHPVARNASQLRALAKLEPARQREIAGLIVQGAKSVADAEATISQRRKPSAEDKRFSAVIGNLARMALGERLGAIANMLARLGTAERVAAVEELAKAPPRGWRIERIDGDAA